MTHWVWDTSPILLDLGFLQLRWYGLFFAGGFYFGYRFMKRAYFWEGKPQWSVDQLLKYAIFGTLVGARLVHCLFYEPEFYLTHPWRILFIWEGGLASHGGYLGAFVAVWLFHKKQKNQPYLWILDRLAVAGVFAGSLIRVGNFFNSEIVGKVTEVPWAVVFIRRFSEPRHPTQLYEAICYFIVFLILYRIYVRLKHRTPEGLILGCAFILMAMVRFSLEFTKRPQAAFATEWTVNMGQWLSIPFLILGAYLVYRSMKSSE